MLFNTQTFVSVPDAVRLMYLTAFELFWAQSENAHSILQPQFRSTDSHFIYSIVSAENSKWQNLYLYVTLSAKYYFYNFLQLLLLSSFSWFHGRAHCSVQPNLPEMLEVHFILSVFLRHLIIVRPYIVIVLLEAHVFLLQFSSNAGRNISWYWIT